MKLLPKLSIAALAIALAVATPNKFAPVMAAPSTKYISEVKVGMDKTEEGAVKELLEEGYTILSKDGKYADLNEEAGSDALFARGQKKVYLGYKTTYDPSQAITDLAVMNMRGGYNVRDYEQLMETRLKTEILPFVERFVVTLTEYRENLNSTNPANKARAEYMKSMLNNLKDDDTGGLLGNLFVNETKYELGDTAYNALSDEEKKQHADIVTIIMQANGKNMLTMETLLTKASDSSDTSWIDRIEDNSLDILEDALIDQGVDITDVFATLDRMFGDDANKLLEKWPTFSHALLDYDNKANAIANIEENDMDEQIEKMEQFDGDSNNREKNGEAVLATMEAKNDIVDITADLELIAAHDRLEEVYYDFEDGSNLAEFFAQDASAFNGSKIRNLYPIVASLSAGQLAGLDFLSIQDLVTIANADATSYESDGLEEAEPVSIYEGVNREIFEKGKVALTNKALRAEAMKNDSVLDHPLSATTYVLWGATALATAGMIASWVIGTPYRDTYSMIKGASHFIERINREVAIRVNVELTKVDGAAYLSKFNEIQQYKIDRYKVYVTDEYAQKLVSNYDKTVAQAATKSRIATFLGAAFTVAMAALAAFSIYSTVKELMDYYKVDYSPIPKYIVEETAITETVNGVTTVKRNDSAYYRVAECNRKPDADFYEQLQNYADLNGDVGREWLALYYVREDGHAPIKADSLKVVTGTSNVPSGYSNLGIHNFETENAYNLTSPYYCYNDTPKGTYVYFKVDESVVANASTAGSNFSTGSAFLFAGIGAAVGTGIGIAIMLLLAKKKEMKVNQ